MPARGVNAAMFGCGAAPPLLAEVVLYLGIGCLALRDVPARVLVFTEPLHHGIENRREQ